MNKYDVVIVGGSCAGAAAGYVLANAGKKVLILDKAIFPRKKLCGGMITEKTITILKKVYDNIPLDIVINSKFSTFGIYHAEKGKICKYTSPSNKLYFVDRAIFDEYFLKRAESIGCTVYMGQKVTVIKENSIITESGEEISADYILGADGSHSIVHKSGFAEKEKRNSAIAFEVDVTYEDLKCFNDNDGIFPKIYFGFINDGYGWVFPKKEFATVGLGGLIHSNKNIRNLFMVFLKNIVKQNLDYLSLKISGFPIPFHNLIEKPALKSKLLLGDAAGLIDPITGEGIYFAILSGKLAAEAILANGDSASNYNNLIKINIRKYLNQAYFVKYFLFHPKFNRYAMFKMKNNAKYCKYYFDLLSGDIDFIQYARRILKDRKKYKSE